MSSFFQVREALVGLALGSIPDLKPESIFRRNVAADSIPSDAYPVLQFYLPGWDDATGDYQEVQRSADVTVDGGFVDEGDAAQNAAVFSMEAWSAAIAADPTLGGLVRQAEMGEMQAFDEQASMDSTLNRVGTRCVIRWRWNL